MHDTFSCKIRQTLGPSIYRTGSTSMHPTPPSQKAASVFPLITYLPTYSLWSVMHELSLLYVGDREPVHFYTGLREL